MLLTNTAHKRKKRGYNKYGMNAAQLVKNTSIERMVEGVALRRAASFLKELAI
jgi:hypothetical protein